MSTTAAATGGSNGMTTVASGNGGIELVKKSMTKGASATNVTDVTVTDGVDISAEGRQGAKSCPCWVRWRQWLAAPHVTGKDNKTFIILMGGGCYLAGSAGYINAVTLDGIFNTAVSHVTGRTTTAGMHFANGKWSDFGFDAGLLGTFMFGAMFSSMLIGGTKFTLTRRYGVSLMIESALLLGASTMFQYDNLHMWKFAMCLLSLACGLQNGMTTFYSGAIIRTTHVTGTLTDIGLLLGAMLCGRRKDEWWKFKVLIPLYLSFFIGAMIGARVALDADALWFPAVAFAIAGGLHYMTLITMSGVESIQKSLEARRARRRRRAMETIRRLQIAQLQRDQEDIDAVAGAHKPRDGDSSDDDDDEERAVAEAALEAGMAAAALEIKQGGIHGAHAITIDTLADGSGVMARRSLTRRNSEPDLRASQRSSFGSSSIITTPIPPPSSSSRSSSFVMAPNPASTATINANSSTPLVRDPLAIANAVGDDTLDAAAGAAIAAAREQLSRSHSLGVRSPSSASSNRAHAPTEPWHASASIAATDTRNPFHPSIAIDNAVAQAAHDAAHRSRSHSQSQGEVNPFQ